MIRTLLLLFVTTSSFAQYLSNPSLEGPRQVGAPPPSWKSCLEWSTPDTQPGVWEITLPPSHGTSYVSLVTRGLGGYSNDGYGEGIGTSLLTPFVPRTCYLLSVDVAFFPGTTFYGSFGDVIVYDTPAILNVWSSSLDCGKQKLLFRSKPIANTQWQTLEIPITPQESISNLLFEADYVNEKKYGNILIDNIRIETFSIDLGKDAIFCDDAARHLQISIPDSHVQWSTGSTSTSIDVKETGIYSVAVNKAGCNLRDTVAFTFLRPIEDLLPDYAALCPGDEIKLDVSTPLGKFLWSNGSETSTQTLKSPGIYEVTIRNPCETKKESIEIMVDKNFCCTLSAPNVFTPNHDLVNDYFEVVSPSELKTFSLVIYNRWGKVVFQSDHINNYWNGETNNNEKAAAGIYYWTATIDCLNKSFTYRSEYRGSVTLLR